MKTVAIILLTAGLAQAGEITIRANADATVMKNKPTDNYGTNAVLSVKGIQYSVKHGFIRFDLTELKGKKIKDATLVLTTAMHHADEQAITVTGIKPGSDWDEAKITWDTAPKDLTSALGAFDSKRGDNLNGATVMFTSGRLVEFIERNAGSAISLVLTSTSAQQSQDAGFATKEHKSLPAPTLKVVVE